MEPETAPFLFILNYAHANIQNIDYIFIILLYIYMQYKCMLKDCICAFCLTYPTTANVFACFSSHWGGCCLKSWNTIEIGKQIENNKFSQQQN